MKAVTQEALHHIGNSSVPERLSLHTNPPVPNDHVAHVVRLIQGGQTTLAADHLLFPEMRGVLPRTVGGVIRKLHIRFSESAPSSADNEEALRKKVSFRQYAYEALLEIALNFYGLESRWLHDEEKTECLNYILDVLKEWENLERREGKVSVASAVAGTWLSRMKRVQKGSSMVAKTALRIEASLDFEKNIWPAFLKKAEREIKENIYYRMIKEGMCRFGNDYALGLRWLRHLGYEQVSTNPYLAARAYEDEPGLIEMFREEVIGKSGTLVARRVWSLFFSEPNRERWVTHLVEKKGLTRNQARLIMDRIHTLPASKRKPFDTYWTLSSRNLVHTEFPDHQENVRKMAEEPRFDAKEYAESISKTFPKETVEQLNQIEDFRKAFEINSELAQIFKGVGISGDFGLKGLKPSGWPEFGPVQKTLAEFKNAYDNFQKEMVSTLHTLARKKRRVKEKKARSRSKKKR